MILTLIKNELIKITKRSKTWIVFALFAILMVGIAFILKHEDTVTREYNSVEYTISNIQSQIDYENNYIEQMKADGSYSESEKINEEAYLANLQEELAKQQDLLQYEGQDDFWRIKLTKEKEELEQSLEGSADDQSTSYIKDRINQINNYLESDSEPVETWEFDAVNYGISIFKVIGLVILVSGIAVFMSDIVSGESTPPTLKFLLVQPISRGKVLLSKFIAVVITVISMICSAELIVFGVVGAVAGFDGFSMIETLGTRYEWDYSSIVNGGEATLKAIEGSGYEASRGLYLIQSFGFQILFIIACCAFVFMISCIFKSSMTTMALSIIISIAVTMVSAQVKTIGSIAQYIFLSYGDSTSLIDGSIAYSFNNANFTVMGGITVMIITSIVSYVIGSLIFKKKDILI